MQKYSNFWNQVLDKLEFEFDNDTFNEVFRPCVVHEFKNGYIVVITPNDYIKTRLNKLYIHRINDIEDKWVVAPEGIIFTKEEIMKKVEFQEKYFKTEIIM